MADLARSPPDAPPAAAAEHQSTDPPLCLKACGSLSHIHFNAARVLFPAQLPDGGIKSSAAHTQHGLGRKRPMDYPLCALHRG
ncbi:hypothetical protein NQZ68_027376 [Dissostichus eleginoides]|nr:hypothetical protein NQZ68_027376 [Dissostichus eleginoides]